MAPKRLSLKDQSWMNPNPNYSYYGAMDRNGGRKNVSLLPLNKIEAIWKSIESFVSLIIKDCAAALFCLKFKPDVFRI